jgi:hypothetical membrane protein
MTLRWLRLIILWFVVCVAASMLLYPGGTRLEPSTDGYSFTRNALSDLGRTVTRSGATNTASLALFVAALTPAGASLVVFFAMLWPLVVGPGVMGTVARLGCLVGMVAGVGYVAVAWTPADQVMQWHILAERTAFRSFLVASVLLGIATWRAPRFSWHASAGWWSFAVLLTVFIVIGVYGPRRNTDFGLMFQTVAQKAIVFSALAIVAFQSYQVEAASRRHSGHQEPGWHPRRAGT